jgi:hypothetical protein
VWNLTLDWDSLVSIVLGYRVWFLAGAGKFSFCHHIQTGSGFHQASDPVGTSGVKQTVHEGDHSSQSSAEVNNALSYTSTSTYMKTYLGVEV